MNQKNTPNKRTIALISLIITNGLFLSVLMLPLSETVRMTISIVMVILLILWMSYAMGGLPSLARASSLLLYFLMCGLLYTSMLRSSSLNTVVSSSIFQSFFTMIATIVLLSTHFPKQVKQAVERWLIQKDPFSIHSEGQPSGNSENSPMPYALYRQSTLR